MSTTGSLINFKGAAQEQRLLPALVEGYFSVDEMSFEDLLTVSVEFASSLTYYNTNLQPSGDWKTFLATNEIVIMASIINKNIDNLRKDPRLQKGQDIVGLVNFVSSVVFELNAWLVDLNRSDSFPAKDLASQLKGMIRSTLRQELHNIGVTTQHLREENTEIPEINYENLSDVWGVSKRKSGEYIFDYCNAGLLGGQNNYREDLRRAAFEFFNAIEHLKSICESLLPLSLKTQSHDPAISLFITFLKLYKYAQDNVNTFTQRHLDYYYHEVLKVQYREKKLESVILNFSTVPGSKPIAIESGSEFTCARDDKFRDVTFHTSQKLTLDDAEIAEIYTLKFEREGMITPECDMRFVTRIQKKRIPIDQSVSDGLGWPIFGDRGGIENDKSARNESLELGFAIASRALFLSEGYRKIKLKLILSKPKKAISFYFESLEKANTRSEFRQALFESMLAWHSDSSANNWALSVPKDVLERLRANAVLIDLRCAAVMLSATAGSLISIETCETLLEEAFKSAQKSKDETLPYFDYLLHAETAVEFKEKLGALLIHSLLEKGSPYKVLEGALDARARILLCANSLTAIKRELRLGRERLFKKYFDTAFIIELSTESGWLEIDRYDVADLDGESIGLQIITSLSSEAPPIVGCQPELHGKQWDTELPILKLKVNPETTINVHSLLEQYCIDTVTVGVEVTGARNIVAFNNISQLDPSKPFYPFGPIPTTSSYLAISAPEPARKKIDSFKMHLHWGELPKGEEGFDGHYSGYPVKIKNSSFTANVSILNNGSWQPQSKLQVQNTKLFSTLDKRLKDQQVIDVNSVEYFRPIRVDMADTELDLGLKTRNGFIKLTIASPDVAFGHQIYPQQLSTTIEKNAKARAKKKKNLPQAPYTPILDKISIEYTASSTMSMSSPSGLHAENSPEKVYRLHPFGTEKVYPNFGGGAVSFFKPFDHDGNLIIGITASKVPETISIYFSLADDSVRNISADHISHYWSYLTSTGWIRLKGDRIVSDGTKGFLCSGIIIIEIPSDTSCSHDDMPGSGFWLKVSSNANSTNFCSLQGAKTHALELTRSAKDEASFDATNCERSKLKWEPKRSVSGLQSVVQLGHFFNIGKDEQRNQLITRVSERIRHRSRAINPWDYERLVLERFSFVGKVLCLPNTSKLVSGARPGSLLLVVTPTVSKPADATSRTPRLSAVYLQEIHDYVAQLSSLFNNIEVINPSYEWVQVRCCAIFQDNAAGGFFVEKLNADIGRFLNPWEEVGYGLNFSQKIKREDIYSYIYSLNYIKYVTDFSMLHVTRNNGGQYQLGDTVRKDIRGDDDRDIIPLHPWSLIIPLERHYIDVSQVVAPREPDVTGIRDLEIGSTFIIGGM